jgi:hypothetical protein
VVGDHALEPQHERVVDLPPGSGRALARFHLAQRLVESTSPGTPLCEGLERILVAAEERLARPRFGANGGVGQRVRFLRRVGRMIDGFLHGCNGRAAAQSNKDAAH